MWRWVTRGLVLTFVAALSVPALLAQTPLTFHGDVDRPDPAKTQSGIIEVRGWALDPGQIVRIELWVDDQFKQNAVMFLPRIDIEQAFPDWPGIHTARPGFITGFHTTDGPHTIEMRIYTQDGQVHFLGRRVINVNNSINQPPFGFVDIPDGNGVYNVSGAFPVNGWAADLDGVQKVEVLMDDGVLQGAVYGDARPDVAATYPDFPAAAFSGWVANVDTTRIENGPHTLTVRVTDRNGVPALIGRRTVQVINNDNFLKPFGFIDEPQRDAVLYGTLCGEGDQGGPIVSPPIRPTAHITPVRGWALDLGTRENTGRVAYAELLVDGVRWLSTGNCGVVEGAFANCYGLPRFDVAKYYPSFPDAPRSGYLFTLDVGALLNLGVRPGNHTLSVRVGDREGTFSEIPNADGIPVFFQCAESTLHFPAQGFIEFPANFDYVGGTVVFRGWALTEGPADVVIAVELFVDGTFVGTAQYGFPRTDVEDQFPFITGSLNSGWMFEMDTRILPNSRHQLTAVAVDNRGTRTIIGSSYFYTENNN